MSGLPLPPKAQKLKDGFDLAVDEYYDEDSIKSV